MFVAATLVAASALALVHVYVGKLRFLDKNPGMWKSAAGGVGIAYAFLVLLPKLAIAQASYKGQSTRVCMDSSCIILILSLSLD